MRGTDLTREQIEAAEQFLRDRSRGKQSKSGDTVTVSHDAFVRMIAWYGALRFVAGRDGNGGTLEKPGILVTLKPGDVLDL